MFQRIGTIFKVSLLIMSLGIGSAFAAQSGVVQGSIQDAQTGDALPGANVLLRGTSLGASTDLNGNFTVRDVPPGSYKIRATYIGYNTKEISVDVKPGETVKLTIKLNAVGVKGKEVVVTAQASGQSNAINQQLSSAQITNVVSAAKIQSLPDANAAESVGRLPGVSLIRQGGEGAEVVIRGLSPQYNEITIDGVQMASDVASSNNITGTGLDNTTLSQMGDRGVNLSMISSSSLGGIQVIKAITPDMDAAVLGGVVNFQMRKAVRSTHGLVPNFGLTVQGAYNDLKKTANNYLYVVSAENRYFDNHFGVFAQASAEERNLSENQLGVGYVLNDKTHGDAGIPDLNSLNLTDAYRVRQRYNGTLVLDYKGGATTIGFMNFLSAGATNTTYRSEQAYIFNASRQLGYGLNNTNEKLNVITNLLSVKTSIPFFQADLRLSNSYSETKDPLDAYFNFVQNSGGFGGGIGPAVSKLSPSKIATYIQPNDTTAWLDNIGTSHQITQSHIYEARLDLTHDFNFSDFLSAKLKFGGMYQLTTRSYYYDQRSGSTIYDGGDAVVNAFVHADTNLVMNGVGLSMQNFNYNGYSYGNFLNNNYTMAYPLNVGLMWQLIPITMRHQSGSVIGSGFKANDLASQVNNYSGNEKRSAAYAMVTFNIGDKLTILPGARYQDLLTDYSAWRVNLAIPGGVYSDTSVTENHGYLLPMVHIIYKPLDWLQIHFAYTNTLNYPAFSTITPRYMITNNAISLNNYKLKPARSQNFDLVFSAYSNALGLFTIDGFTKDIKDLAFFTSTYVTNLKNYPDLPQVNGNLWQLDTYINSPYPVRLYGVETDWQTHFWYLPGPLSGLILNVNYTHIFSQAHYPKTIYTVTYDANGNFVKTINDTNYTARLLNQPNDIANLAIGYDYQGFSVRMSMIYQNDVFHTPDFWMQLRVLSAAFTRWDLSISQMLPWHGLQLYLNAENLTGSNQVYINEKTSYPASEQRYGADAQLGLRVKF